MNRDQKIPMHDFKGIGFSKIGHFKEVRAKIKELEKVNVKLERRGSRLEAIFDSMSDGLTILDRNMNVVFANRVQKLMFPDFPLIGQKCFTAYYRKKRICKDCPALKTIQSHETLRGEILIKVGEYSGRYLEWTTSPINDALGAVEEIILLMRDITERKEYEFKIMQADRMAAIGFLVAGIAHEINNPLTSIAGFSEGLIKRLDKIENHEDPKLFDVFNEYLSIINNEAYRCKDIISNLQDFSRSSNDKFKVIRIDQIVADTTNLFRQHAKDNNIRIIIRNNLAADYNLILGSESQLQHVFLNLFNSAIKAMGNGGRLKVLARNVDNSIEILISDTREDNSYHQLADFYDPSCLGKPLKEGADLGLSICHNIIQHHKGEFEVKSQKASGLTFILRFPAYLD